MNIVYNIEVKKKNDPYVTLAEEVNHYFSLGVMPGSFMVDYIPARASFLPYLFTS